MCKPQLRNKVPPNGGVFRGNTNMAVFSIYRVATRKNSPADIYLIKVTNRNTIKCEIYSKLTMKTLLAIKKLSLSLILNRFKHCSDVFIDALNK